MNRALPVRGQQLTRSDVNCARGGGEPRNEANFVYGRADRKVNDGITLEQSHFCKIH